MNQTTEIRTPSILATYQKNNVSALKTTFNMSDGEINLPTFCDLLSNTGNDCQSSIIIQKVNICHLLFAAFKKKC